MGDKLSHKLIDLGFFSALGTIEHAGGGRDGFPVKRGTPNTCDNNNGVTVVYDETGRPWILHERGLSTLSLDIWRTLVMPFALKRGAHVPHSNDGGRFVHEVVDKL